MIEQFADVQLAPVEYRAEALDGGEWITIDVGEHRPQIEAEGLRVFNQGYTVRFMVDGKVEATHRPKVAPIVRPSIKSLISFDVNDRDNVEDWRVSYEAEQAAEKAAEAAQLAADRITYAAFTDRDAAIAEIRRALKARSGKAWSVKGNHGTAWGWIDISAPPKRRVCRDNVESGPCPCGKADCGQWYMTDADRRELGQLLGLGKDAHYQGVSVAAGSDYRIEYVQRARGEAVTTWGRQYWD